MHTILKVLRYVIFGFFIVCNAIVASVAVWNHSLALSIAATAGWKPQIDIYLIFLGCFGLALIFSVIFVELAYRHAITGRVWFECLWTGLFSVLYIAGAAALTAISPPKLCTISILRMLNDTCVSTQVLLAFTWITAIILLAYFSLLVGASICHVKHDSRIWHSYVHKFPWGECRRSLPSAPVSPSLPRFLQKMPSIVAPKPRRPAPAAIYAHPSGLGSEYEIESYATPVPDMNHHHPPFHPQPSPFNPQPQYIPPQTSQPSFYPQYMQSALTPASLPAPTPPLHVHPSPPLHPPRPLVLPPDPSPLGNWPRPNAVMRSPTRPKRKKLPTPTPAPETRVLPAVPAASMDSSPPRPRPSGPRRRDDGEVRPAEAPDPNGFYGSPV